MYITPQNYIWIYSFSWQSSHFHATFSRGAAQHPVSNTWHTRTSKNNPRPHFSTCLCQAEWCNRLLMIISSYNLQKNKHQLTPALWGLIWPWDWLPCSQGWGLSLRATVMLATLMMIQRIRQQHWDGRVNKLGSLGWREDSGYQWY